MPTSPPNRYAAPKAEVRDFDTETRADIDDLPVSETWKNRFRLIEAAGGVRLPHIKTLKFNERGKAMFNVLAFLFGPLYYIAKGLWRQAITFTVVGVVVLTALSMVLSAIGIDGADRAFGYGLAAVFAARANVNYYKRMVLNDNGWW